MDTAPTFSVGFVILYYTGSSSPTPCSYLSLQNLASKPLVPSIDTGVLTSRAWICCYMLSLFIYQVDLLYLKTRRFLLNIFQSQLSQKWLSKETIVSKWTTFISTVFWAPFLYTYTSYLPCLGKNSNRYFWCQTDFLWAFQMYPSHWRPSINTGNFHF